MDLLGAYDSDSDSGGGGGPSPPAVREDAATEAKKPAATKRVVKLYPVTDMKALADEEDYRPRKRQQTERRGSSLFDSLPKPQTELHDWGSRAAAEKKGKGEAPRDVAGVGGRHQDFPSDSRAPSSSGATKTSPKNFLGPSPYSTRAIVAVLRRDAAKWFPSRASSASAWITGRV